MFNVGTSDLAVKTIHPTQKFTLMNLLQMPCVITWAWSFLTSTLMKAVRGQKWHERVDLLKKVFNESFLTTSKTPKCVQPDLSYNLKVESYDF